MLNPNNTKELAFNLSDIVGQMINEETLKKLSEKQRNYLVALIGLWERDELTRDNKDPLMVMKDILKIKTNKYSDKTNWYLKNKLK